MSNSTRPGGYDERLVVPLEASRRGAHRARVSPLLAALPLLAVIVVVAAVIGVAYTLFLRPGTNDAADPLGTAPNPAATTSAPAASAPASQPAASATTPAGEGSSSAATGGTVDKAAKVSVYNGSVPAVNGLAREGSSKLTGAGFTAAGFVKGDPPVKVRRTTVYYATEDEAATARAVAKALGVGTTKLSADVAGSGIVVILANDFAA
jgi:LytR cell envelope-related transcriptional attenuator